MTQSFKILDYMYLGNQEDAIDDNELKKTVENSQNLGKMTFTIYKK